MFWMFRLALVILLAVIPALPARAESWTFVACAPGFPGSTEQAQPFMDALAGAIEAEMALASGTVRAVYDPSLETGMARLTATDAVLALVPLPFFSEYAEQLDLRPLVGVEHLSGSTEIWSLVARRGALEGPEGLEGWRIVGVPAYAPAFVRRRLLADWGELPAAVDIRFSSRSLSMLRKAAAGEPIAVLLDRAQTEALEALDFASELEVVARSPAVGASVVCRIDDRLKDQQTEALQAAFLRLHKREGGAQVLEGLRLARFVPLGEAWPRGGSAPPSN